MFQQCAGTGCSMSPASLPCLRNTTFQRTPAIHPNQVDGEHQNLRDQSVTIPFAPANVYESFRTKLEVSADPSNLGLVTCSFCVPGAASAYPAGGNDPSAFSAAWQTLQRTGTWFYSSFGHLRKHRRWACFQLLRPHHGARTTGRV